MSHWHLIQHTFKPNAGCSQANKSSKPVQVQSCYANSLKGGQRPVRLIGLSVVHEINKLLLDCKHKPTKRKVDVQEASAGANTVQGRNG